jgi:hypothetical protein
MTVTEKSAAFSFLFFELFGIVDRMMELHLESHHNKKGNILKSREFTICYAKLFPPQVDVHYDTRRHCSNGKTTYIRNMRNTHTCQVSGQIICPSSTTVHGEERGPTDYLRKYLESE